MLTFFFSLQKSRTWMMHEPQKENGNLEQLVWVHLNYTSSHVLTGHINYIIQEYFFKKGFFNGGTMLKAQQKMHVPLPYTNALLRPWRVRLALPPPRSYTTLMFSKLVSEKSVEYISEYTRVRTNGGIILLLNW